MAKKETKKEITTVAPRYTEGVGRRKTAVARVRLVSGQGKFLINNQEPQKYFSLPKLAEIAVSPLTKLKQENAFDASAKVQGGGLQAQAEAVRHGVARALAVVDPALKPRLRSFGFLTRDSRMVERKKYGLKKARRAPQWAKR